VDVKSTKQVVKVIKAPRKQGGGKAMRPEILDATATLVATHMRSADIVRRLVDEFALSDRHAHRYLAAVRLEIAKEHDEQRPQYKHYTRATLQWVIRRAMQKEKLAVVVAAVDRLARLDGLYAEIKLEHTHQAGSGVLVVTGGAELTAEAWLDQMAKERKPT
jgi:tRNA 2-selenouridine synthase SelU